MLFLLNILNHEDLQAICTTYEKNNGTSSNKNSAIDSARAKYKLDEVTAEITEYFRHRHPKYR